MYQFWQIPGVLLVGGVFVGWATGLARGAPMAEPSEHSVRLTIGTPVQGIAEAVDSDNQP
jgi:hypothetical protein